MSILTAKALVEVLQERIASGEYSLDQKLIYTIWVAEDGHGIDPDEWDKFCDRFMACRHHGAVALDLQAEFLSDLAETLLP